MALANRDKLIKQPYNKHTLGIYTHGVHLQ